MGLMRDHTRAKGVSWKTRIKDRESRIEDQGSRIEDKDRGLGKNLKIMRCQVCTRNGDQGTRTVNRFIIIITTDCTFRNNGVPGHTRAKDKVLQVKTEIQQKQAFFRIYFKHFKAWVKEFYC